MNFLIDADKNSCVITTKDADFTSSFWLNNKPEKLLLISTGNIQNKDLESLFITNFGQIIRDLSSNRFVELTREHVIVRS